MTAFVVAGAAVSPLAAPLPPATVTFDGTLSVLTYNVKGLPWPIATGRVAALSAITAELRDLRRGGRAPHVVLLQEAMTDQARAVTVSAGYRYVVDGPTADTPPADARRPGGSWWQGETARPLAGSGLQIASDFPIVMARSTAFSRAACAGYDCLANKGAVLVRLSVGGEPIDVVNTHLNSRGASGASLDRADRAYAAQVGELARFVRRWHDPRIPLVFGGDFNLGAVPARRQAVSRTLTTLVSRDALDDAVRQGLALSTDARETLGRGKDRQFLSSGTRTAIGVASIAVPFGHDRDGRMLSDHIGYVANLTVRRRA